MLLLTEQEIHMLTSMFDGGCDQGLEPIHPSLEHFTYNLPVETSATARSHATIANLEFYNAVDRQSIFFHDGITITTNFRMGSVETTPQCSPKQHLPP